MRGLRVAALAVALVAGAAWTADALAQPAPQGEGRPRPGGKGPGAKGPGATGRAPGAGPRPPRPDVHGGPDKEGDRRRASMGETLLKQGNFRAALSSFEQEIAASPDSVAAHVGRGKALARLGRCGEALTELWQWVGTKPFGDEAALLASVCSSRLGLLDDSLFFSQMAVEIDPENTRALTQYALDLAAVGDLYAADEVIGRLEVVRPDRDASLYVKAVLALRAGDIEEFDRVVFFWPDDRNSQRDLARLEAQSWLDMDDPIQVIASIKQIKRIRRGKTATWLRAEAVRRLDMPEEGLEYLESKNARGGDASDADAVRARVLADLGDLAGAQELVDRYADDVDPDIVATAWYLARKRGDAPAMADYAALYERVRVSPLRDLDQLVPWSERGVR